MDGSESLDVVWNENLEHVEEAGGVRNSDVGSVNFVSGRVGDSDVGDVGRVVSDREYKSAVDGSDIETVDEVFSSGKGVQDSEVQSVGNILADSHGIEDSFVGSVDAVASAGTGIHNSEVGSVDRIFADTGITDSEVGHVGRIKGQSDSGVNTKGIASSAVDEVEVIEADAGIILDSEVEKVGRIEASSTGVGGSSEIGSIDRINSGGIGVRGSPEIEYIGHINADRDAVKGNVGQLIEQIESIDAGGNALGYRANVGKITGETVAEESLAKSTKTPVTFLGDIEVEDKLFSDTQGHIIANENTKASYVDGDLLQRGGHSNLVITYNLEVDEDLSGRSTVITPPGEKGTINYHGDFSRLVDAAGGEGMDFLKGLKQFGTPENEFSGLEELMEEDSRQLELYDKALRNLDVNEDELGEFDVLTRSFPTESLYQARIGERISRDLGEKAWPKMVKISGFGEVLSRMDGDYRSEFYDRLKTGKDRKVLEGVINEHTGEEAWFGDDESSLGDRLFRMALDREFYVFVDDEASQIEGLLDSVGDLPEVESIMEDISVPEIEEGYEPEISDSPYRQVLEEMVERYEEDIRLLSGLSDIVDVEGNPFDSLKPVKDIKNREAGRHAQIQKSGLDPEEVNERLDSNPDEYSDWFGEHIDSKIRDYVQEAVLKIGKDEAETLYSQLVDGKKAADEIGDEELAALKVYARSDEMSGLEDEDEIGWSGAKETVEKLFDHRNRVYSIGENQEWLDRHGYDSEELVDPRITVEGSELFEATDLDRKSAVSAEIDPRDVEVDAEGRQEKYMDQVRSYMKDLGLAPPEDDETDIELVERKLKELDPEMQQTTEYQEAIEAINNYKAAGNMEGGVPDEMVFRVATPMETTLMGKDLQSCHDPELGSYGWAAISHAVKPNTIVMNAGETEDDIQARVKAYVTEDEDLVYHHTSQYQSIDADLSQYFEEYMSMVSHELGLGEPVHASEKEDWDEKIELLEAHEQYLRE